MIHYPQKLNIIFQTLLSHNLQPIIVGGFVRDALLNKKSKDIDIEVYNLNSYETLEKLLEPFGEVNSVGKSFGVCKLRYEDLDLDFSLPRTDNKIGTTHKEFKVQTYSHIDFKTAALRRDFSINALGYDVKKKKLLDPFSGVDDLKNNILRVVNEQTFSEDPLRVLRAMQFCARFELSIDTKLFTLCKTMVSENIFNYLPKERVFEEFKKLFLKAEKPSLGLSFFKEIGSYSHFCELKNSSLWEQKLQAIDRVQSNDLEIFFTLLTFDFTQKDLTSFLDKLTNDKKLIKEIFTLHKFYKSFSHPETLQNYDLYKLASQVQLQKLLLLSKALYADTNFSTLEKKIKELNIMTKPLTPFIQGKDLVEFGLKPSQEFKNILQKVYEAQMKEIFSTKKSAKEWIKTTVLIQ